uniref:Uncharacterized protein n=1 Tax=Chlamydomonas euryale TaxID=1486919 RepID=A0A7R9Z8Q1_9CHLO|mmetsp:Transcript_9951/g.30032  ORF Transcript_9951/g.30032 Transcript_9951/m.30032 type:complete len:320 (+) Transcript_9951:237-1196(+)
MRIQALRTSQRGSASSRRAAARYQPPGPAVARTRCAIRCATPRVLTVAPVAVLERRNVPSTPSSYDDLRVSSLASSLAPTTTPGQRATPSRHAPPATVDNLAASGARLRVAVDVDEVLGRFVHALNGYCAESRGMHFEVEDYFEYVYAKVWGVSQDESTEIVHSFFESKHFLDGIPVVPGAYEALCRMAGDVELVVVTSRQHAIEDLTLDWLDANYPALFQEVYFGNHFAKEGVSRKKSEICKSIGAGVLIDDNPGYALECAEAGINVLLYDWEDKYPWSKLPAQKSHPLITVVRNWEEVEEAVAALMPETTSAIDLNL